jgi:branched-chain amino acid aminotransferase
MKRMNITHKRMSIMEFDGDFVLKALDELIKIEKDWVPPVDEMAMYIRPFCIGNGTHLGVKSSDDFIYCIILSPVGAYYPEGMAPTKIYIEDKYVRSVEGGTGAYKAGANYAGTLQPGEEVLAKGFSQICWLDAKERKYIEEVGTSNIVFVIDGKVVTPTLKTGTILPGITRDTTLQLAREWGYDVEERPVSVEEVFKAADEGKLNEAFATGTAAVISPVGLIHYKGKEAIINDQKTGPLSQRIYDEVTDLQYGRKEDTRGWIHIVE